MKTNMGTDNRTELLMMPNSRDGKAKNKAKVERTQHPAHTGEQHGNTPPMSGQPGIRPSRPAATPAAGRDPDEPSSPNPTQQTPRQASTKQKPEVRDFIIKQPGQARYFSRPPPEQTSSAPHRKRKRHQFTSIIGISSTKIPIRSTRRRRSSRHLFRKKRQCAHAGPASRSRQTPA